MLSLLMYIHTYSIYKHTHTHTHMYTGTDRQTDKQTDKQTDRQVDRQTETQTHTRTQTHTHLLGGGGSIPKGSRYVLGTVPTSPFSFRPIYQYII